MSNHEDISNDSIAGKRNHLPIDEEDKLRTQVRTQASLNKLFELIDKIKYVTYEYQGHYDDVSRTVKVPSLRNLPLGFGKQNANGVYLTLYEALFCFEAEIIIILYNNVQLSLAEAYHLFLGDDKQFKNYIVFQKLTTAGFCVLPHDPMSFNSKYESKCTDQLSTIDEKVLFEKEKEKPSLLHETNPFQTKPLNVDVLVCPDDEVRQKLATEDIVTHTPSTTQSVIYGPLPCDNDDKTSNEINRFTHFCPVSHYWSNDNAANTNPIIGPDDCHLTMQSLLDKLRQVGPQESSRVHTYRPEITFDVYIKDTFVKRKPRKDTPGRPDLHIVVVSKYDQTPSLVHEDVSNLEYSQLEYSIDEQTPNKLIFAIVDDNGSVCYYNISTYNTGLESFDLWKETITEF